MHRRTFFQTGIAAGVVGIGGGTAALGLATRGRDLGRPSEQLRLNSNENPLGLSPAARRAVVDRLTEANRYPGAIRARLIEAIAKRHGVAPKHVVVGAGSTEILKLAVHATAAAGGRLVVADPTFEDVARYGEWVGMEAIRIPLTRRYTHDLARMRDAAESGGGPTLVFLCNPNNPTGTVTSSGSIAEWIGSSDERTTFLVDEAYYEYAMDVPGYHSALHWLPDRPNVVVSRTFSKIFAMAGLRLGYAVAHPDTAGQLRLYRVRNNANQLAAAAGLASLDDAEFIRRSLAVNERGKAVVHECLDELDLEYLPSHTNFVMHRITGDLESYIERMRTHEVRVGRPFPPMLGYNRLSIGLPQEMEQFADTLRAFRRQGWI